MKNQKGFTLVEVITATAILGVVVVIVMNLIKNQQKNEKNIEDSSGRVMDLTTTGTYFQSIASNAGLSQFFMHLPVKNKQCSESDPCVRKWNPTTRTFENQQPSTLAAFNSVEFFRDSSAQLEHLPLQNQNYISGSLHLITSEEFIYMPADGNDYYTTWPLLNEKSQAFVAMVKDSSHFFTFTKQLQKASTTSSPYKFTLLKSKSNDVNEDAFKNKIFLTYSSLNLKHYFLKQNNTFENCTNNKCSTEQQNINSSFPLATLSNEPYYKFEFSNLKTSTPLYKKFPDLSYASTTNNWVGQNNFLFFPHASYSIINKVGNIGDFAPNSNVDIKALSHSSVTDQMITMPVSFVFYNLKAGPVKMIKNRKQKTYNLVEERFFDVNNKVERVLLTDITGKVYFARKLGSTTLSLIVTQ